jgi:hypothetical protein
MIRLTFIVVQGVSEHGAFMGRLDLGEGVQIISAHNSYGKSLAAKAVAWCLGVETMFGVSPNDPSFFPDAVSSEIDLPIAVGARVLSSECSIGLLRSDGASLTLTRQIMGDTTQIQASELVEGEDTARHSVLQTRNRSMQDATGGFQHFFFEWMGWPRTKVATFRGEPSEIYLENLAPSFYIEQKEGWTAIQALQVSRYSQVQISQIATEYLLGALDSIGLRVSQQEAAQQRAVLKESAEEITNRVNALFSARGWAVSWSSHGSVAGIAKRWRESSLLGTLKVQANVDLDSRIASLNKRIGDLRKALTSDPIDPADLSTMAAVSQQAVELKNERHRLNVELNSLKLQERQAAELVATIESRIQSAADLVRLKSTGVGRLDHLECPTCHRDLDPSTFALSRQSLQEVEAHIEGLRRDRALMKSNATSIRGAMSSQAGALAIVDEKLREADQTITSVADAIGTVREQLTRRAADLSAAEREQDRVSEVKRLVAQLQDEIDTWIKRANALDALDDIRTDVLVRRTHFQQALIRYVRELGHNGVMAENIDKLRLDEDYVPFLGSRRLHALGSASDQSRLVAAYSLALADASMSLGGLHPGLVLLDEPLQQNPDDKHRELLFASLTNELSKLAFQLVIFTWLPATDIIRLREAGITVIEPRGDHFLQLLMEATTQDTLDQSDGTDKADTVADAAETDVKDEVTRAKESEPPEGSHE